MTRVFDLEGGLPGENERFAENAHHGQGPAGPNRLPPETGQGLSNYGRIFASRRSALAGGAAEADAAGGEAEPASLEDFVAGLRSAGVERSVVAGPRIPNAVIADAVSQHPAFFVGLAYVSPYDGMRAARELERLVIDFKLSGLMVSALTDSLPASDRRYYPLYARCVELGVPVRIYTSMNYANDRPYDLGHPRNLDQVACDFPELTIIAGLSGWPWANETTALLRRHPNLYADTAAHRPRYFGTQGSGWETFLHFGNSILQDKIMVGLSSALLGAPVSELIGEYENLPLKDAVRRKWLYDNAARVFGAA
jgi:predicted TIM-barrel fold metal-dependent hydrolase